MLILFIIFLAFIQSLTEFLPVSSSAHIVLLSKLSNIDIINKQNDIITIALHIGSILAVMIFYKKEIIKLISFKNINLLKNIFFAFIPIAIIGGIISIFNIKLPKNEMLIGIMLIIFGIILYIADKYTKQKKLIENLNIFNSFFIGVFQIIALIPGVSRSGITITAGRLIGLNREDSIKFSLLLSIPTIGASSFALAYKLFHNSNNQINYELFKTSSIAIFLSTIFSYFVLKFFLNLSKKVTFFPFVIYRIIIGLTILIIFFK